MIRRRIYKFIHRFVFAAVLPLMVGCPVPQSQRVPHEPLLLNDSEFRREYFLYLPTGFGKGRIPLVVTCHGTNPWDSARLQINEWKHLAEVNNFVVVAPVIDSARGFIPPSPPDGTRILEEDEKFILKVTRRFLNNPGIDPRAVLITGWSAGGFATYYVGLRHPDIYRVIAARQCNFIREYYPSEIPKFNPYQPILIFNGEGDLPLLKADSLVAYRFLKDAGQKNLTFMTLPGGHSRHPELAWDFFQKAIRKYPQPTIVSAWQYPGQRHKIRFDSQIVGPVDSDDIFWDFGDGDSTPGRVVDHLYQKPGRYQLVVMRTFENQIIRFVGQIDITQNSLAVKPRRKN